MGLPQITIVFKSQGTTAIKRGERGIVALLLKDNGYTGYKEITSAGDIPSGLSASNKEQINLALIGGVKPPKKVVIFCVGATTTEYDTALTYFETVKFDYLAFPDVAEVEKVTIGNWIKKCRNNLDKKVKAVLPDYAGDDEGIVNFATTGIKANGKTYTHAQYCARIAGLIAGTPLTMSATFAVLPEVTDVPRLGITELSTGIDAGKFLLFHDGEKVKVARAVNSLTTTTADKGEDFKKIKIVDILDLIHYDIKKTSEDNYLGKFANSYDNKCLLISAINGYYAQLEADGLLDKGKNYIGIDIVAQTNYITSKGYDVSELNEQDIKEFNTADKVFLGSNLKPLDAIEDITLNVLV